MPDSKSDKPVSAVEQNQIAEADERAVADVESVAAIVEPVAALVDESIADSALSLNQRMEDRHKELMACLARVGERVDAAMAALENAAPKPADEAASVAAAEVAETPVVVAVPEPVAEVKPEKPRRGFSNVLRYK